MHAKLGSIELSDNSPPRVMGIINVSPESFFKGSVRHSEGELKRAAEQMEADGAAIIDIGARSTAPYLKTDITVEEEIDRICSAIRAVKSVCSLPVAADTYISEVARAAQRAGADILNDISGLMHDENLANIASTFQGAILMANGAYTSAAGSPVEVVTQVFTEIMERVRSAKISPDSIVLDPGIGFFRSRALSWDAWDKALLQNLEEFQRFKRPLLISASRKSFIGRILGYDNPEDRLFGSLAIATHCVNHGVQLIRTHDVRATQDIIRTFSWLA